jgi:hypothetical protein
MAKVLEDSGPGHRAGTGREQRVERGRVDWTPGTDQVPVCIPAPPHPVVEILGRFQKSLFPLPSFVKSFPRVIGSNERKQTHVSCEHGAGSKPSFVCHLMSSLTTRKHPALNPAGSCT